MRTAEITGALRIKILSVDIASFYFSVRGGIAVDGIPDRSSGAVLGISDIDDIAFFHCPHNG